MFKSKVELVRLTVVMLAVSSINACSSSPDDSAEHQKAGSSKQLSVPPDLGPLNISSEFNIPAQSASTYSQYTGKSGKQVVLLPKAKDIRFVRDGALQWLEVDAGVKKVWPKVKQFFQAVGFNIATEDATLGYFETDWQKNLVSVPGNWFSSVIKGMFADDVSDRFRVRFEAGKLKNSARIYITHQGLVEGKKNNQEGWVPRAVEHELETEMLKRVLVYYGVDKELAVGKISKAEQKLARLGTDNNKPVLRVGEGFARAWRRVGIALDRLGLVVEDRNRTAGFYYVKLPDRFHAEYEKSWFKGLFSKSSKKQSRYILSIEKQNGTSIVGIRTRSGGEISQQVATTILTRLQQQL